jgi:hypothetical protein
MSFIFQKLGYKIKKFPKMWTFVISLYKSSIWFSSHKGPFLVRYVWHKLCHSIHYNVQYYVVFIITYVTLKWQLDIRYWHIYRKCYMCHFNVIYIAIKITYCTGWNHKLYPMHVPWAMIVLWENPHFIEVYIL